MNEATVNVLVARRIEMVIGSARSQRKMRSLANREFGDLNATEAEIREACQRVQSHFSDVTIDEGA